MSQDARPLYFPAENRTLFGWLHPASGPSQSDLGVVICKPFGYDAICAHESIRAFAENCAAAGANTLRFDYSGTGDSGDGPDGDETVSRWCADIEAAIDALQRTCGTKRICLLGIRLGALLGALVAARRPVDCQIAIAPVVSGRRYVRELRAFQAGASTSVAAASPGNGDPVRPGLEVTGFWLSDLTVEKLKRTDLADTPVSRGSAALIVDRKELPDARRWADHLESAGTQVRYVALPGYADMVSTPHAAVIPVDIVRATHEWLESRCNAGEPVAGRAPGPQVPLDVQMRIRSTSGVELTESATFLDDENALFGIVTEAPALDAAAANREHGVILLNCGATSHIGPNRMSVDVARRWAAQGYVVLRFDIAGLGDSDVRAAEHRNEVYSPGALYDVSVAMEFLKRHYHVKRLTLIGVCSGGYHALRSAITGLPVAKAIVINPLTFYWRQGDTLSDLQISEVVRNPGVYFENAFSLAHWRKLLRGKVNLWRVVKVFVRRAWLSVDSTARDVSRKLGIRIANDVGWDLASVAERGIPVVFVFARGDAGLALLQSQAGSMLKKLGNRCRVNVIEGGDHIFSPHAARQELIKLLDGELAGSD